ncbi:hypothetical protein KP509_1Z097700 [Ceratopteris richardii]|nr:hypothetical protein KP509_1Z097700 [Ceratopteris richardii]
MEHAVEPLTKRKAEVSTFDFRLHFQVTGVSVPGWNNLVVSVLSINTGRIIAKTSRGIIHNGSCQWPDPVLESIKLVQNPSTGEYNKKPYKLFVQTGSLRDGILGEATIDLTEHITAGCPEQISLPLRNCNAGAVLHVKVHCVPQKLEASIEKQRSANSDQECPSSVAEDNISYSDVSESRTADSQGSLAAKRIPVLPLTPTAQRQYRSCGVPFIAYKDEGQLPDFVSDMNNFPGIYKNNDDAKTPPYGLENRFAFDWPYANTKRDQNCQENNKLVQKCDSGNPSSQTGVMNAKWKPESKQHGGWVSADILQKLEVAEVTIQDLREETLRWERQAWKLTVELESFRQKLAHETKHVSELNIKLCAIEIERDNLKAEVDQLKAFKIAPQLRGSTYCLNRREMEDSRRMIKILQEEIQYEKEVNGDLQMQLSKTQSSNADLLIALTEVEDALQESNKVVERITEANRKLEEDLFLAQRELQTVISDGTGVDALNKVGHKPSPFIRGVVMEEGQNLSLSEFQVGDGKTMQQFSAENETIDKPALTMVQQDNIRTPLNSLKEYKRSVEPQKGHNEVTYDNVGSSLGIKEYDSRVRVSTDKKGSRQYLSSEAESFELPLSDQSAEAQMPSDDSELQNQQFQEKIVILEDKVHALERQKGESLKNLNEEMDTQMHLELGLVQLGNEVNKLALDIAARDEKNEQLESQLDKVKIENLVLVRRIQNLLEERQDSFSNMDVKQASLMVSLDEAHFGINGNGQKNDNPIESFKNLEQMVESQKTSHVRAEDSSKELDASQKLINDFMQKLQEMETALQVQTMICERQEEEFSKKARLLEGEKLELQERIQCLELEVKAGEKLLNDCMKDLMDKETELLGKIADLKLLNEELASGSYDTGTEQLQKELIRLQNQNSFLSRKEQELLSQVRTQEVLQDEVNRLQEVNDLLEARLSKLIETAKNPFLLEKIVKLETQLAEAIEEKNAYKEQLISMFDKEELCEPNHIVDNLQQHTIQAKKLQADLDNMRNMHIDVSLRCAQLKAERDDLVMTVKNLKKLTKS